MVTGSQKAFMMPPGLAFLSVSPKGWEAVANVTPRSFYFDLAAWRKNGVKGFAPWTPNVSLLFGLKKALELMLGEGLDSVWSRHKRWARVCALVSGVWAWNRWLKIHGLRTR